MKNIQEFLNWFRVRSPKIPKNYEMLLDNIDDAEGGTLHRNRRESNITNGWGIYKALHPNALLWKYVDLVSSEVTDLDTEDWEKDLIDLIDSRLDKDIERYLSYLFYKEYLKGAHLELFDKDLVITMANLYTNSPEGAWMSVQEGIWDMYKYGLLDHDKTDISGVDGGFGGKTKRCLLKLNNRDFKDDIIFKQAILLAMKSYYTDLTVGNPDKYLRNGNGWDNRMEDLQHSK